MPPRHSGPRITAVQMSPTGTQSIDRKFTVDGPIALDSDTSVRLAGLFSARLWRPVFGIQHLLHRDDMNGRTLSGNDELGSVLKFKSITKQG